MSRVDDIIASRKMARRKSTENSSLSSSSISRTDSIIAEKQGVNGYSSRVSNIIKQRQNARQAEFEQEKEAKWQNTDNLSRVSNWFISANEAVNNAQNFLKDTSYSSVGYKSDKVNNMLDDIMKKSTIVNGYLDYIKDTSAYNDLKNQYDGYIETINQLKNQATGNKDFANSFANENEYNTALNNAKNTKKYAALQSYDDFQNAIADTDDEDEITWLKNKADDVATAEELQTQFDSLSNEYESLFNNGTDINADIRRKEIEEEQERLSDKIKFLKEREQQQYNMDKFYNDIVNNNVKAQTLLDLRYSDTAEQITDTYSLSQMSANEIENNSQSAKDRKIANLEKELKADGINIDKFYKYADRKRETDYNAGQIEKAEKVASKHPVFSSAVSIPANTFGAVVDAAKYALAGADKLSGGDGYIDTNGLNTTWANTLRETVGRDIENPVGQFFYDNGMSLADFIALLPLNLIPGGQALSLGIMSTSAGSSAATNILNNGGTLQDALATGVAQGIAEAFFEKFSLEQLKAFKTSGASSVKEIVINTLKASFTEGSEEAFTDLANLLTDQIINGNNSDMERTYHSYLENGYSEEEAGRAAWGEFGSQLAQSFAGGALSGGVLGGGVSGITYTQNRSTGKAINNHKNANQLVDIGLQYNKETRAYKLADEIKKSGKTANATVGALRNEIVQEAGKAQKNKDNNHISDYIERSKLSEEEKAIANKVLTGKTLEEADVNLLNKSKALQSVIQTILEFDSTHANNFSKALASTSFTLPNPTVQDFQKIENTSSMTAETALNKYAEIHNMNEDTKKAFIENYNEEIDVDSYAREFIHYNNLGRLLVPYNNINHSIASINDTTKTAAYKSGLEIYKANARLANSLSKAQQEWSKANGGYTKGMVDTTAIKNVKLTNDQKSSIAYAKQFAEFGVNIQFFKSKPNAKGVYTRENGSYNSATNTVTIDINAHKNNVKEALKSGAILSTLSHELTHISEHSTDEYMELRNAVQEVVGADEWDSAVHKQEDILKKNKKKWNAMTELERTEYASKEALAEFCSSMLKHSDILEKMAQDNPKAAKSFIDAIKKIIKKIRDFLTKHSGAVEEARILEDVAEDLQSVVDKWDKAVIAGIKNQNAKTNVKEQSKDNDNKNNIEYSIRYTEENNPVVVIEDDILDGVAKKDWVKTVKNTMSEKFKDGIPIKGRLIRVNKITRNEYTNSKYSKYIRDNKGTVYEDKFKSANNLDEIIIASTNYVNEDLKHSRKDNFKEFARGDVLLRIGNNDYSAKVIIGFTDKKQMVLYDLINFNAVDLKLKKESTPYGHQKESIRSGALSNNTISQLNDNVNNNSMQESENNSDIQYQERDKYISNRELLVNALEGAAKNGIEIQNLRAYKEVAASLDERTEQLAEIKRQIKEISFTKGSDRSQLYKLNNQKQIIENIIVRKDKALLTLEAMEGIQNILAVEKKRVAKKLKDKAVQDIREIRAEKNARIEEELKQLRAEKNAKMSEIRTDRDEKLKKLRAEKNAKISEIRTEKNARIEEEYKKGIQKRKDVIEVHKKSEAKAKIKAKLKELDKLLNHSKPDKTVKQGLKETASKLLSLSELLFSDISKADIVRRGFEYPITSEEQVLLDDYRKTLDIVDEKMPVLQKYRENLKKSISKRTDLSEDERNNLYKQEVKVQKKIIMSAEMDKLRELNSELKDLFAKEREFLAKKHGSDILNELSDAYKSTENSPEAYIRNAFDENIIKTIDEFKEEIGCILVKNMSLSQLEDYNKIVTMILTKIKNANKLFAENIKATCELTATDTMNEIQNTRETKELRNILIKWISDFNWDNLKPIYAFRFIGSKTFEKFFWNVQKGELDWFVDAAEAKEFWDNCKKDCKYSSFDFKKKLNFKAKDGSEFSLGLNQMMDIYAASRRPQALQHLLIGGFTFQKNTADSSFKVNTGAKSYPLSMETIQEISSKLSANERQYVEKMQEYLSTVMADKGNEVSMALYGVKLFNEPIYWNISSSDAYIKVEEQKVNGEFKLKLSSFTKATKKNASNPIVLRGFDENWCNHVNQMSLYHSMTLPLEDLTKVFNYNTGVSHDENNPTAVKGVRSVIRGAFGNAAENYIRQFLCDLNGGIVEKSRVGLVDNAVSLAKKSAVFANLSVILQQPTSVFRAMAYIDKKHFVTTTLKAFSFHKHNKDWAQLKKYAPIAGIKEMGSFDTGIGKGVMEWLSSGDRDTKIKKAKTWVDDKLSMLPALADELAWVQIWHAVQKETYVKHNLKVGTEENLIKSGERFNEVIQLTQVYDSVLSRSNSMRSKQTFDKIATSFMAEPTTIMNMVFDAAVQLKRNGKSGIRQFTKTTTSVAVSIIANALLKSLVGAGRDDDEDETYSEKYIQAFTSDLINSVIPTNYYPILKDVTSIIEGYTVERTDMSLISDIVISLKKLTKEDGATPENIIDAISYAANLTEIPVRNIIRDWRAVVNTYNLFTTQGKDTITDLEISIPQAYQKTYDTAWENGYEENECEKKAVTSVKAKIRKKLKPLYLNALKNRDFDTVRNIRDYMRKSGYYSSLNDVDEVLKGWRENSDEEEKRAKRAEERK